MTSKAYYYFVASLPSLSFESKPTVSVETFLRECDYQLSSEDSNLVRELIESEAANAGRTKASAVWIDFNNTFKNQMAACRAKKMGKDPNLFMRGERTSSAELEALTLEAMKTDNLLEAEKMIDKRRWEYLDDLEGLYFFDLTNIIVYGLKLKILEKYNRISSDEGSKILEQYKDIETLKGVYSGQ